MASFTVENMCGFLIRSKLLAPDEMKAMYQRWQAEAKDQLTYLDRFMPWLVQHSFVTEYQAGLLAKGHADDFFLNQYMILERVGRGRMAGVYKARHKLGQIVAIKVLPPSRAKSPQLFARFQREARLSIKLKHPNVVRSFQVGEANKLNYLVMEFLEGETFDEVLGRRKKLPPHEAVRLVHQALLGLQHIHEQGMVHRDLKPANLMLVPTPVHGPKETTLKSTVKILDIGLAREMYDENAPPSGVGFSNEGMANAELTGEGVLLGTPDYLAPEQARDPRAIDIRADIYSLGCVLYHLLAGQPPFPDRNILNQLVRHATEEPTALKAFNPKVPEGLQQIVNWMMAKKPEQRYPTPARAAQALEMFLLVESEQAKQAEEEAPQLKKYLTWLEIDKDPPEPEVTQAMPMTYPTARPVGKPKSSPEAPAAKPRVENKRTDPAVPLALDVTSRPEARKPKKERSSDKIPVGKLAAPLLVPADAIDVELVPLGGLPKSPREVTRRDWIMAGVGAGAALLLCGFCLLGWKLVGGSSDTDP